MTRGRRRTTAKKNRKETAEIKHSSDKRKNMPSVANALVMKASDLTPTTYRGEEPQEMPRGSKKRERALDPQLIWRGKTAQRLEVAAPPLFVQERVSPKTLIDDIKLHSDSLPGAADQPLMFQDFNGLPPDADRMEFYQHEANWSNRMILGDNLQAMASLVEREKMRGGVQCIFFDPPYGVGFNSNFQRRTDDMGADGLTHEPEMVKAFTDAWRDDIHSYMSYLRDRMLLGRDLLAQSGSMFVQISDTNQHRVRALMDEVFGANNFVRLISFRKTPGGTSKVLSQDSDYLVWYAKSKDDMKYRELAQMKNLRDDSSYRYMISEDLASIEPLTEVQLSDPKVIPEGWRAFHLTAMGRAGASTQFDYEFQGVSYNQGAGRGWRTNKQGMDVLAMAGRLAPQRNTLRFRAYFDDYGAFRLTNTWTDLGGARGKRYVVETNPKVIRRCILMTTDPGDLVLDPTCGGGTTAFVAEQWGRRWITIDTSRIAVTLTRSRIMSARYDYYRLKNQSNIRAGFEHKSVAHVSLKTIVNNGKVAEIYQKHQQEIDELRRRLNGICKTELEEWQIGSLPDDGWPPEATKVHAEWWSRKTKRQVEIDKEIAASAGEEPVLEAPLVDRSKIRVSGPFTVESVLPHRVLPSTNQAGNQTASLGREDASYVSAVLANLKASGARQTSKSDHITFTRVVPFADDGPITAEGEFTIGAATKDSKQRKAAILVAGQFDTLGEADIVGAAREAAKFNFDTLICCAFRFDAQAVRLTSYGKIDIFQAVMNAELHMADKTKLGAGPDLFFVIGEPDIDLVPLDGDQFLVRVNGMDVYNPKTRQAKASDRGDIAMWFMDTNYNNDCFFVRHAYFLDASDPFDNLKKTLKSEINEEAWSTLNSNTSRPFPKPTTGYIAVKIINRIGDEVMKVIEIK